MKKLILPLFIFCGYFTTAQKVEQFYDWQWKPCQPGQSRFYSLIEKTDSGWHRNDFYTSNSKLQMTGLYKDSVCKIKNGFFKYYYPNNFLQSVGNYVDNKLEGVGYYFYSNGMVKDSSFYVNGKRVGTCIGWHQNGYMSDSTVYDADGSAVEVEWFDNGNASSAGRMVNEKKNGAWVYYHQNGKLAAKEVYEQDKLISREYFSEGGLALSDTTNRDRQAQFKGGSEKWKIYLLKSLVFPSRYELVNTDVITVVVNATIDEEGNVKDVFMTIPFKNAFDSEAQRVLKQSPKWLPAINHNRRVKMFVHQPISFAQVAD